METMLEDAWDEVQNMCDTWVYETLGAEFDCITEERDRYKEALMRIRLMTDDHKQEPCNEYYYL